MHKILIVDSEVGMLYALQTVLERAGYQVYTAQTCAEARNSINQALPDLIILSKEYPDETCWKFSAELKTHRATQHIPFIVYGNAAYLEVPADMERQIPADSILIRPASSQALLKKVRELITVVPAG